MKKLSLLLVVCMVSMLAFAQTDSSTNQTSQDLPFGVTLSPSSIPSSPVDLGNQAIGNPTYVDFVLTNGSPGTLIINNIGVASDPAGSYSVYMPDTTCGSTLGQGKQCLIEVLFQASAAGPTTGTISVNDSAGTQTAYLSAMGIHYVTLASFSNCYVNVMYSDMPCILTLTNQQTSNLRISGITPSSNFKIVESQTTCGGLLPALSSCAIAVAYIGNGGQLSALQGTLTVTTGEPAKAPPPLYLLGCRKYCQ